MKTVLITGATGLIGQEIAKVCQDNNWMIHYLTTSKNKIQNQEHYKGFYWNPDDGNIDINCFNNVDVIINLVGASISKRWTSDYKKEIITSRTETAQLLFDTIKAHNISIKQFVSASAIGIYPSSQTNYYDEDANQVSDSFLGHVVEKWESAVNQFQELGIIITKIRIGLVMSENGGALPEIIKPIRLGAGAAFGNGQQWQSWIHIKDLAKLFAYAIEKKLSGVYNGVAPNPVSNSELTKTAARVLDKPLLLPNIPKFAMKLVLGDMHILLFESQRVSSQKVEDSGFNFEFHHLQPALEDLLN